MKPGEMSGAELLAALETEVLYKRYDLQFPLRAELLARLDAGESAKVARQVDLCKCGHMWQCKQFAPAPQEKK